LNEAWVFVAQIASGLFQSFPREAIAGKQSIRAPARAFTTFSRTSWCVDAWRGKRRVMHVVEALKVQA
jgi:hypothetical protein